MELNFISFYMIPMLVLILFLFRKKFCKATKTSPVNLDRLLGDAGIPASLPKRRVVGKCFGSEKQIVFCWHCGGYDHWKKDCTLKEPVYWRKVFAEASATPREPFKPFKTGPNGEMIWEDNSTVHA